MDYLCNCKSEISNVCNAVEGHCLQVMKIVHHHANGRFHWLISEHKSINPLRVAISILSGKYERFMFEIIETLSKNRRSVADSKISLQMESRLAEFQEFGRLLDASSSPRHVA